ncbi:type III-B CRISPR-associated protein Cas10/Cmr2 [Rhizobium sp. SG2393]|uniref:Cas10/Cmr2 second palm domain-containing protein n=1 Tax=Rhizobium sp. SG2393 TaxID=3276279 RepID=UPI0036702321
MTRILHFSLGPVQGFIADARRTRDLWAGSFLLSWLSGKAMEALIAKGGTIIFPDIAGDDIFRAICASSSGKKVPEAPFVGSLPNRFKADVSAVSGDAGKICVSAIENAWKALSEAIWTQFIEPVADKGLGTRAIWDRQILSFWQTAWVAGDDGQDDVTWLDQRKNWRDELQFIDGTASEEGGDLCVLMGNYQEISGYSRLKNRVDQDAFYAALREKTYQHSDSRRRLGELNIGTSERLCAIALVKRLFPLLDDLEEADILGWRPGGDAVNVVNWPSVSYMAALPWLQWAERSTTETERERFVDSVRQSLGQSESGFFGETTTQLFGLPKTKFFALDGHLLHRDGLITWPLTPTGERGNLLAAYDHLTRDTPERQGLSPTEFYALLLMDGDRIGEHVGTHSDVIKDGLSRFTRAVKDYFAPGKGANPSDGALIYAGGDDVLALLPLDTALDAARALRRAYQEAFHAAMASSKLEKADFTISGTIVIAQYKIALRTVLDTAHHYLDKIAKKANGRDSLSLAVLKPGGIAVDWTTTWDPVQEAEPNPIDCLLEVARAPHQYSTGFLYNVRSRYAPLTDQSLSEQEARKAEGLLFSRRNVVRALLSAEYRKQPRRSDLPAEAVDAAVKPLLHIGFTPFRQKNEKHVSASYQFDSAILAHFLGAESLWNGTTGKRGD